MALNPRIGIARRTKLDGAMRNKNELEHLKDELATANEILMAILPLPMDPYEAMPASNAVRIMTIVGWPGPPSIGVH